MSISKNSLDQRKYLKSSCLCGGEFDSPLMSILVSIITKSTCLLHSKLNSFPGPHHVGEFSSFTEDSSRIIEGLVDGHLVSVCLTLIKAILTIRVALHLKPIKLKMPF